MVDHSDIKKQIEQNMTSMIWKGQQAKYKYLFQSFYQVLTAFVKLLVFIFDSNFEAVFIEISLKMTVTTKLWTF